MRIIRRVLAWLAAAAVLILGFAWLAGWFNERTEPGEEPRQGSAGVNRQTVEVTVREVDTLLPVPGRLWAAKRTRISAEIMGKIAEVAVMAGDRVAAGDILVRLDQTELSARTKRIREQLPAQRVRVDEAQAEYNRRQQLLKEAAVSREQAETSRRLLAEARANLGAAEQQLTEAEAQLEKAVIRATTSGTVVDRLRKVGEVAIPGEPLLEIYQAASLRLECSVPESLVHRLRIGQNLHAELGPRQEKSRVTIDEIVPQAEARSRTVLVKARVPEATMLLEGQYGRMLVPLDRGKKIFVPANAVQSLGQLDFAEELLQPLAAIRNTNRVTLIGGRPARLRVELDPGRLAAHGLSALGVTEAVRTANCNFRAGEVEQANERFTVEAGPFLDSAEELRNLIVATEEGRSVFLREVATVTAGPAEVEKSATARSSSASRRPSTSMASFAAITSETGRTWRRFG